MMPFLDTAPRISERQFMAQVIAAAKLHGWTVFHPFDSRRSTAGFPDLVLVRGRMLLCVELKTERGRLTAAQRGWIETLRRVEQVHADVWRPSHWPKIERMLGRQ